LDMPLTMFVQVLDEVRLRLQLVVQLAGLEEAEAPLLALEHLVALHLRNVRVFIIIVRI
jgi:hypothetical protein